MEDWEWNELEEKVVRVLEAEGPASGGVVAARIPWDDGPVAVALARLFARGAVEPDEDGRWRVSRRGV